MNAGSVARAAPCAAINAIATMDGSPRLASALARMRIESDQRANAVGSDPAVAHDVEFLLARRAAAKTVGRIGKPVLVQAAGRQRVLRQC